MKNNIWIVIFLLLSSSTAFCGGIDFFHGTWEEAIEKAAAEEKVIFVDAYTTWCGPCKRMAAKVFTDEAVGKFFNANFVNMKIDMEKKDGIKFQQKYPVAAYPTLYFIDGKGKVVQKVKGAQDVKGFLGLGNSILSKVDYSGDYAKLYEEGDRSPELIHKYVKALNKSKKPSGKVAYSYIKSQKDLDTPFNLQFLFDALASADSKIFTLVTEREKAIAKIVGTEAYQNKIKNACTNTLSKAIEYSSADLLEEAIEKMKENHGTLAEEFEVKANMDYQFAAKDPKAYMKAIKTFQKKYVGKADVEKMFNLSLQITQGFKSDEKLIVEAIRLAGEAAEKGNKPEFYLHHAQLLLDRKQNAAALVSAKKALELAKGDRQKESMAIKIIRTIENA